MFAYLVGCSYVQGSDTTSNTSCAIAFHLAKNVDKQKILQAELDEAFGNREMGTTLEFNDVKALPYLQAAIYEGLRMHNTLGLGLPRLLMQDCEFKGQRLLQGSECSVPTYTLNVSKAYDWTGSVLLTHSHFLICHITAS